jgi:2-polyprenyl-6-hydroxyphenyl methylase/3-demethylubiquinone-9 3-methyltransferase
MDILEHVEEPNKLIEEAARVLLPGGLFFFHTFNRNFLSYLLVIKGVDIFVKNAPKNMHVYQLFITPDELKVLCQNAGLNTDLMLGFAPTLNKSFWQLMLTRKVPNNFSFHFTKSLSTGYCGIATKR